MSSKAVTYEDKCIITHDTKEYGASHEFLVTDQEFMRCLLKVVSFTTNQYFFKP